MNSWPHLYKSLSEKSLLGAKLNILRKSTSGAILAICTFVLSGCAGASTSAGGSLDGSPCTSDDFLNTIERDGSQYVCTEGPEGGSGELRWNIVGDSDLPDTEVEQTVTGYDPLQLSAYQACVAHKGSGSCPKPQIVNNPNQYDAVELLKYQKCVIEQEYATSCGKPYPTSNPAYYDPVQLTNYAACLRTKIDAASCSRPQPQ